MIGHILKEYSDMKGILLDAKCGDSTIRLIDQAIENPEVDPEKRYRVEKSMSNGAFWGRNHATIEGASETVAFTIRTKLAFY